MPQNRVAARYYYVDATSATATGPLETIRTDQLDIIFRAQYARIARIVGRIIHDQSRAEELAVEVFLKWWQKSHLHDSRTEGWLYRTAVREAFDELRRQSRRERFEHIFGKFRDAPLTPEHLCAATALQQKVRIVLAALNRRDAELLLLRSEGLSYQDLALALNVNANYIGSLLTRAQVGFRKEYIKRYGKQS